MTLSIVYPQLLAQASVSSVNLQVIGPLSLSPRFSGVKVCHVERETVLAVSLPF